MQTFLTAPDYRQTAKTLDQTRLGKQRLESAYVLSSLLGVKWHPVDLSRHPVVSMWRGHEGSLFTYVNCMCDEWVHRGFLDSVKTRTVMSLAPLIPAAVSVWVDPTWLADSSLCSSHRAVLLAKDWSYYKDFGWLEKPAIRDKTTGRWPYVWPVSPTAVTDRT